MGHFCIFLILLAHFFFINKRIINQSLKTLVKKKISIKSVMAHSKLLPLILRIVTMIGPNTSAVIFPDILFNRTNKKGMGSHKVEIAVEL